MPQQVVTDTSILAYNITIPLGFRNVEIPLHIHLNKTHGNSPSWDEFAALQAEVKAKADGDAVWKELRAKADGDAICNTIGGKTEEFRQRLDIIDARLQESEGKMLAVIRGELK